MAGPAAKMAPFISGPKAMREAVIESLDHEGRGVARVDGKAIFIEGALPGERVTFSSYRVKPNFEQAEVVRVLSPSSRRVTPRCPHFGVCGGCSMQHLESGAQVAAKQRVLENALWHIGRARSDVLYPPIVGPAWGYRYRARLSVRMVPSKGGVLIGFHERRSSYVAPMESCAILPPHVSAMVPRLRALISGMSAPDRLPQIEIAVGEGITVLVFTKLVLIPVTLSYIGVSEAAARRALAEDTTRKQGWLGRTWSALDRLTERRAATVTVALAAVMTAVCTVVMFDLRIGDLDPGAPELRQDSRYNRDSAYITAHYGLSNDQFVVIMTNPDDGCRLYGTLQLMDQLAQALRQTEGVQATASAAFVVLSRTRHGVPVGLVSIGLVPLAGT